jgi:hypothetical protein
MPTATPPPCDEYEPNDDRSMEPNRLIRSGETIDAKICEIEPQLDLPTSTRRQDNYFFEMATGDSLQIELNLPDKLVTHIAIRIYKKNGATTIPIENCYKDKVSGKVSHLPDNCSIHGPGLYVIRLYTNEGTNEPEVYDDKNSYTLTLTY